VYYKDSEFLEVGSWVYNNFDVISGVSFLPFDGGTYQQAPYERITEGQYTELLAEMPEIPTELLPEYEKIDTTTSSQELACSGATGCEL
jgi:ribonucleoside-diphosphate reductase alpha chain